ncbi:hypothetical protein ASU31_12650 [Pedobacter ginsenosidimutans]|uniref:Methyltransferase type 11 domain-containing protein n=1 Tax=Pedobacter ginsenosidimutans TaxID=687842 RepID=A0A0T5VQJ8_9SPHI|nr:class I SAM-dependent methyltransferase [Pedobacter ginsenosidimutans]KRT15828.1 hypothetical protein ASU31_12650 [Pedobacter ginsenosidimutans]
MLNSNQKLKFTGERLTTLLEDGIMVEHLHRYAIAESFIQDKVVLDIASGEGYGAYLMSKFAKNVVGVDISEEAVTHSNAKYKSNKLVYKVGSTSNIPLEDLSMDVIVSFETIEHHDKHLEMLQEFKRVLKKDGLLIISSPDKLYYSDIPHYRNPFHVKELYEQEFVNLIKGFFTKTIFLNQRCVSGSLIVKQDIGSDLIQYEGDYKSINYNLPFTHTYNIALASDTEIKNITSSIFESNLYYEYLKGQHIVDKYINSTTWKVGRVILFPFFLIKKILNF